ncbi:hypothetical protein [Pseudomonas oryzihabitans]|uniref:hypothetical protein n=1 Tax=Pseudomonas oryzihabitans TaxID=47885 RepID=UPI000586A619|nr:hypothetical protein [Pseudomonas psychrotolerans]
MNRKLLLESCRMLAGNGVWCIPESALRACAGYPDRKTLGVAMARHVKAGVIERYGPCLYVNPFLKAPASGLFRLANFLRPNEDFYLSCESILSECGWISQIPFCLTFVTTGRSYRFSTPLGDIDFTSTAEDPSIWQSQLSYNDDRQIWEASPDKALADLKRYNRNLGLVLPESERPY